MIFIDANILLDFFLRRKPFYEEAKNLFTTAHELEVEMLLSSLSVSHCFYFVQKHLGTQNAYRAIEKLSMLFSIESTGYQHIETALKLRWNDFEDALQYSIAKENKAQIIITRDKEFKKGALMVKSPVEAVIELYKL